MLRKCIIATLRKTRNKKRASVISHLSYNDKSYWVLLLGFNSRADFFQSV